MYFFHLRPVQKDSAEITLTNAPGVYVCLYFHLYFDFAGYSDMAIGTGYLLGIRVPENFNQPFLAKSMKELWERWHMSRPAGSEIISLAVLC